jgi:hypothetical protein
MTIWQEAHGEFTQERSGVSAFDPLQTFGHPEQMDM